MAEAPTAAAGPEPATAPRPWTQGWVDALPLAPAWIGCAVAFGHVLLGALYFAVFVAPHLGALWAAYQDVVLSTCVFGLVSGYAVAALAYARRGHATALRDLRPVLACNEAERSALERGVLGFDMAALRRTGLVFAIGAVAVTYFSTSVNQRYGEPAMLWVLWQNGLGFWLLVRTIEHDLRISVLLSRAAQRHAEIELFDLTPLAPLARRGLQSALLILLALSFFSLILGAGDISPVVPVIQVATVLLAAFALVLPSIGVRRRVRDAKREELTRIAAQIRTVRAPHAASGGPELRERESRLATLLALKQHVETTREWPFDLGTLGRFLLYAGIGVGSWLGGATVERLLDLVLG